MSEPGRYNGNQEEPPSASRDELINALGDDALWLPKVLMLGDIQLELVPWPLAIAFTGGARRGQDDEGSQREGERHRHDLGSWPLTLAGLFTAVLHVFPKGIWSKSFVDFSNSQFVTVGLGLVGLITLAMAIPGQGLLPRLVKRDPLIVADYLVLYGTGFLGCLVGAIAAAFFHDGHQDVPWYVILIMAWGWLVALRAFIFSFRVFAMALLSAAGR